MINISLNQNNNNDHYNNEIQLKRYKIIDIPRYSTGIAKVLKVEDMHPPAASILA
jgi:hypothetical protein